MAEHPLAHKFAEIQSGFHASLTCRTCRGNGPIWSYLSLPDGTIKTQPCCGQPGETEYVRVMHRIDRLTALIEEWIRHDVAVSESLTETVRMQSWLYRLRKWWANRRKERTI